MSAQQYPATPAAGDAFKLGGQYTYAGYIVTVSELDFVEVGDTKYNPDGSFRAEMVYSRRRKATLDMEATGILDGTEFVAGGVVTINAIVWKIQSAPVTYSRNPVMLKLSVIEIAEMLDVISEHTA
jgi:hypothetical protein